MTASRHRDDMELLFVINALDGCILSVVVWLVDDMHSSNTLAADPPVQTVLATPFHIPRNTSHGGGAHFWVGTISIAACSNCLNDTTPVNC